MAAKQQSLFKSNSENNSNSNLTSPVSHISMASPLANRVRPRTLDQFIGQDNLLGKDGLLRHIVKSDHIPNMIFWGPPGCGKTTLAEIIAHSTKAHFVQFSAADTGIRKIKKVMRQAEKYREIGKRTIVFVDEIHRFNKSQQDAFLQYTEKGSIILIGATTENPSFYINSALQSRCKVFVFHHLKDSQILELLKHALNSKYGFPRLNIKITPNQLNILAKFANGDARSALNNLAMAVENGERKGKQVTITDRDVKQLTGRKFLLYDKKGDEHYDLISALHKSVRNSDVNSAIYWLYRMLGGGEDPIYIARRLVRMSSEDVGLTDPGALNTAVSAFQACQFLGMPECQLALVEATVRLALDPKSNALYRAGLKAKHDVKETMNVPVPLQIRNAPTKLMEKLGYHHSYKYAENYQDHTTSMQTMPKQLRGRTYYHPSNMGQEARCQSRMKELRKIKAYHKKYGDRQTNDFKPMDLNQF